MSYGVNRTWAQRAGPARRAGRSKGKSTRTAKRSKRRSAPHAKRKRTTKRKRTRLALTAAAPSERKRTKPRGRKPRAKKPKAPKLYKRYDPVTGELAKVTKDDPRYDEWRTTRGTVASRKKKLLREAPLEYARTFGVKAVKQRAERTAGAIASRTARAMARPALKGVAGVAAAAAPYLPAVGALATLTAAALAAVLLQNRSVSNARLALGDRINALSLAFVDAQKKMAAEYHVPTFAQVPAEARARLLAGYKQALDAAQRATVVQQSGKFGQFGYHTTGR